MAHNGLLSRFALFAGKIFAWGLLIAITLFVSDKIFPNKFSPIDKLKPLKRSVAVPKTIPAPIKKPAPKNIIVSDSPKGSLKFRSAYLRFQEVGQRKSFPRRMQKGDYIELEILEGILSYEGSNYHAGRMITITRQWTVNKTIWLTAVKAPATAVLWVY